jgi:hypothetical protein
MSALGRIEPSYINVANDRSSRLTQIPPADLHIPILGQLAPAQLPLGHALEPGPLEVVRLGAGWGWRVPAQDLPPEYGSVFPSIQTGHRDRTRYLSSRDQEYAAVRR